MNHENPYAPPIETPEDEESSALPAQRSLSGQGVETVQAMTKWMKFIATLMLLAGIVCAIISSCSMIFGTTFMEKLSSNEKKMLWLNKPIFLILFFLVLTSYCVLGGMWLRQSARSFLEGISTRAEGSLAKGFRKLRLYFMLIAGWGILDLIYNLAALVVAKK